MTNGFFERVLPASGPYTLVSGETAADGKLAGLRHWNGLESHADVEREVQRLSSTPVNVFFAVGSYAGKNRADPIAKRALYLDLDSKEFGSIEDALRRLMVFVKAVGLPPPSIYVHSGRGVHVYWCLDADVPVAEWLTVAQALKAKCIELEFPADPTVTADPARILRAPGSLNRKGKDPIPCRVLGDNGSVYPLSQLAAQLSVGKGSRLSKLAALASNEDLATKRAGPERSAADVTAMLEHIEGGDRDEWITVLMAINDWSGKSEVGFGIFHEWSSTQPGYVSEQDCRKTWNSFEPGGGVGIGTLIHKARENGWVDGPVIAVVDPTASLAEQMTMPAQSVPAPTAAVPSQANVKPMMMASPLLLAAAHALAGAPRFDRNGAVNWLANEFVLVANQKGVFYSLTAKEAYPREAIDDLLTRFMPMNAAGIPLPASKLLRNFGTKDTVHSMGFYPGMPTIYMERGKSYVNRYSQPDDLLQGTLMELNLIDSFWNFCFPNEEDQPFSKYMRQFYGHIVQHPAIKIASAPLLISRENGTGKTTLAFNIPKALSGSHNTHIVSNKVLKSPFTNYVGNRHFLHFDEVHINGKWDSDDTANAMKNLITGTDVEVHGKGLDPYNIPNRLFITATSNFDDAISLPNDSERRWGVYYLKPFPFPTLALKETYFQVLHAFINSSRGPGVLRWYFSKIDLSDFNAQSPPPVTDAKQRMITRSQTNEVQILIDAAAEKDGPFSRGVFTSEAIGQYLRAETGKNVSAMGARFCILKAFPRARIVGRISVGHAKARVWCHEDFQTWGNATPEELKAELDRQ